MLPRKMLAEADGRINLPMLMIGTADESTVKLNQSTLRSWQNDMPASGSKTSWEKL